MYPPAKPALSRRGAGGAKVLGVGQGELTHSIFLIVFR